MTAGLMGSGTEVDPWLITSMAEMLVVLRDPAASGFYRIVADLDNGIYYTLAPTSIGVGNGYPAKVIDGDGYTIRINAESGTSGDRVVFAGVHFRNIVLRCRCLTRNASSTTILYRCSATDVAVYADRLTGSSGGSVLLDFPAGSPELIPPEVSRLVLLPDALPSSPQAFFLSSSTRGVTLVDCYVYTNGSPSGGLTKLDQAPTLELLDGLSGGAFSDNDWWEQGAHLMPYQSEPVVLTVQTIAAGVGASRRLWLESERYSQYLGESDAEGAAQFTARIRKHSGFMLLAAEDFGADDLRADKAIASGYWYLPPVDNGFVYQADSDGRIINLAGVSFGDQPVLVDGITFIPRPRYAPVLSTRRSVARNGAVQQVTLDNSGGGTGPVIDGDSAYLDGVVEEIHPMTGQRQALGNCEVVAFERRGDAYVAMGSTYSDGIGGFRLETDVYGGGDVFAFATDFPGVIFQPGVPLNVGDRIRPALANGYVYEIIQPGTAGPAEPVWWPDAGGGTEGDIGTARARARPYYQPVAHGPYKMILIE